MHTDKHSWLLPFAASLAAAAAPAQNDPVASTRLLTEKWLEASTLISKEKSDWKNAKDALEARIDVVNRQILAAQKRIAAAEASIAEADKKRVELVAENDKQKATAATLEQKVAAIEQRVLQLLPRLPEPLKKRVEPLSQRIPQPGEEAKLALTERYGSAIGIIDTIHKWNREITVTSEVRALPDGTNVEVAVLYVGIGQAYYAGSNGKVGGVGSPTADGWHWRPANELAPAIAKAIAVHANEQPAAFVQLPVQIQ